MFRTTGPLPNPGHSGLSLPTLLRRVSALLLLAALLTAMLAACGGNDEEKRATETATAAPAAGSDTPAPQLNTPTPIANETVPGGIEAAARRLLADELGVGEGDFKLHSSEGMAWSDASLGCPQEGMAYAQVITPGYKLVFDLAGTSYAVHTNDDGANAVVCHDDSGGSTSASDTPTPKARTQEGAVLTTQEYAEALEEAFSGENDEIEDALEELFAGTLFTDDELERMSSLEIDESWSEEDAEFASEFGETVLRATTGAFDRVVEVIKDTLDEVSVLRPPDHLSDFHGNFTATLRETVRVTQERVETVKRADTDIGSPEELAEFITMIDSLEAGPLDPELAQEVEEAREKAKEACLEFRDRLEAELERDVSICE